MNTYRYKIVLLGEGMVGKTSILLRYVKNTFDENQESTKQISYYEKMLYIGQHKVTLVICDTAGQEKFHALAPIYYRDARAIVLVYDITDKDSFGQVQKWLKEIDKFCEKKPVIIIVGSKLDLQLKRAVPKEEAENYAKKLNHLFIETSSKSNTNINKLFMLLTQQLLQLEKSKRESQQYSIQLGRQSNKGINIEEVEEGNEDKGGCNACWQ